MAIVGASRVGVIDDGWRVAVSFCIRKTTIVAMHTALQTASA